MKGSNISSFQNYSITTDYSFANSKSIKNCKSSFNIESSEQLKKYLEEENIFVLKTIIKFVINASRQFSSNLILFYEIILSLIEKLNSEPLNLIKLDENDNEYIKLFIKENKEIIDIINENFHCILNESVLDFYFFSKNSYSLIVILYIIMVTFTFYTFEIEKMNHPKKDILRLLLRTKNKYLSSDKKINWNKHSKKHLDLMFKYLNTLEHEFQSKYKKISLNSFRKPLKSNQNLFNIYKSTDSLIKIEEKINDIQKDFHILDILIEEDKKFSKQINDKLFSLSFNYEKYKK